MRISWLAGGVVAVAATVGCGAAQMVGARATQGAAEAARQQALRADPSEPSVLAERAARGTVQGALSQMDTPEQREQLASTLRLAFAAGVRGGIEEAMRASSERADAVAATTELISASAVRGARQEIGGLFPECRGSDRDRCVERRLGDLSRAVSSGVAEGMRELFAIPLLLLGFVCGIATALALSWIRAARS